MRKWTQPVPPEMYRTRRARAHLFSSDLNVLCLSLLTSGDELLMDAYANVVGVRSPTAISSPAAVKKSQSLMIWVQWFWSISLPYANS